MNILIVEDESKIAESLSKGLSHEGHKVDIVSNGIVAEQRIMGDLSPYDVVLLDLMIPGKPGLEVCKAVRDAGKTVPIIMLTAKDTKEDIIRGLDMGADDYLVKPFSFEELLARLRAIGRRPRSIAGETLSHSGITLDTRSREVSVGGKEVHLTAREYAILEFLLRNPGRVVSREEILAAVWDFEYNSFSNVVDVHIKNLRKKINSHDQEILQTVRGAGYKIEA
jgi:DNA-binding response OmpR family regulator